MSLWAVVPVKGLGTGKSRLDRRLGRRGRRDLNEWLLRHMVDVLCEFPGARHSLIVSRSRNVLAIAARAGLNTLKEIGKPGLNPALRAAAAHAQSRGASRLLVLPCDLPLLDAAALRRLATGTGPLVTVALDRAGHGTNGLYIAPAGWRGFRFGRLSAIGHRTGARRAGYGSRLLRLDRLAFDLDTARDYGDLVAAGTPFTNRPR